MLSKNHGVPITRRPHPTKLGSRIKKLLTESPRRYSRRLAMVNDLALLNQWRKSHRDKPYFQNRTQMYDYLAAEILGNQPVTYLEFGVYRGDSIRYWANLNTHPESQFVGFDTFEGLPERWEIYSGTLDSGHFTTQGRTPDIKDPRVRFVKGLFQDTLPPFLKTFVPGKQLVINNDSDLYSSTLFTLCSLHSYLKHGTVIIFDEFSQVLDEFRAFEDYCKAFLQKYEVLGSAGQYYDRVAVQMQGS